jgi:hypothetical protein
MLTNLLIKVLAISDNSAHYQGHFYFGEKIRQLIVVTTFTCQAFCWGSTHTLIVPKLLLSA